MIELIACDTGTDRMKRQVFRLHGTGSMSMISPHNGFKGQYPKRTESEEDPAMNS